MTRMFSREKNLYLFKSYVDNPTKLFLDLYLAK